MVSLAGDIIAARCPGSMLRRAAVGDTGGVQLRSAVGRRKKFLHLADVRCPGLEQTFGLLPRCA